MGKRAVSQLLATTTPGVEGYRIAEYLGVVSCDVALGRAGSGMDNVREGFGARNAKVQTSMDVASRAAMDMLSERARAVGANAIVGLSLSGGENKRRKPLLLASGTAVRIEPVADAANMGDVVAALKQVLRDPVAVATQSEPPGSRPAGLATPLDEEAIESVPDVEPAALGEGWQGKRGDSWILPEEIPPFVDAEDDVQALTDHRPAGDGDDEASAVEPTASAAAARSPDDSSAPQHPRSAGLVGVPNGPRSRT